MSATLRLMATITPKPEHQQHCKTAIETLIPSTRDEVGCLQFDLFQSLDTTQFILVEQWRNQAALDAHLQRPDVQAVFAFYREALANPVVIQQLLPLSDADNRHP